MSMPKPFTGSSMVFTLIPLPLWIDAPITSPSKIQHAEVAQKERKHAAHHLHTHIMIQ